MAETAGMVTDTLCDHCERPIYFVPRGNPRGLDTSAWLHMYNHTRYCDNVAARPAQSAAIGELVKAAEEADAWIRQPHGSGSQLRKRLRAALEKVAESAVSNG